MLMVFACGKHFRANWGATGDQLIYCPVAFTSEYGLAISDLILDAFIFLMPLPFVSASTIRARSTRVHLTKINQGLEAPFDDSSKNPCQWYLPSRRIVRPLCPMLCVSAYLLTRPARSEHQ